MPLIHKIISTVLVGLAVTTLSLAQTTTPSTTPSDGPGLIGKRYVGVDLFSVDYRGSGSNNANGGAVFLNVPVHTYLDLAEGGAYAERCNGAIKDDWKQVVASLTAHTTINGVTPFFDVGLTHSSFTEKYLGSEFHGEGSYYQTGAGFEIPLGQRASLALRIGGEANTQAGSQFYWQKSVKGAYWLTPRVASVASVSFYESLSVFYSVGIRLVF